MSDIAQKGVELLLPFSNNYSAKFFASKLASLIRIPQQSASRYLNKFAKQGILNFSVEGKNKLFYFDLSKQVSSIVLSLIEHQKSLKFLMSAKCAVIINEFLTYCDGLIIFGSHASGKVHKESDLDLVLIGKCNKKEIKKIKNRQALEINEHCITYSEFSKLSIKQNTLSIEILKNHILFGNISKLTKLFLNYKKRNPL